MKDGCLEAHFRWQERVFTGESESRAEETSHMSFVSIYSSSGPDCATRTSVELCVVVNHEHDFPLEYIVVDESTADARYALVVLHLLELPG